jgi:hypothetical protein
MCSKAARKEFVVVVDAFEVYLDVMGNGSEYILSRITGCFGCFRVCWKQGQVNTEQTCDCVGKVNCATQTGGYPQLILSVQMCNAALKNVAQGYRTDFNRLGATRDF